MHVRDVRTVHCLSTLLLAKAFSILFMYDKRCKKTTVYIARRTGKEATFLILYTVLSRETKVILSHPATYKCSSYSLSDEKPWPNKYTSEH